MKLFVIMTMTNSKKQLNQQVSFHKLNIFGIPKVFHQSWETSQNSIWYRLRVYKNLKCVFYKHLEEQLLVNKFKVNQIVLS